MQVLIADNDVNSRNVLQTALTGWGYDVLATGDGLEAWQALQAQDGPKLAILDWVMPGMQGVDVCRKLREQATAQPPFLILLTSRGEKADVAAGLNSGANDYITKPFVREELQARLQVARSVVEVQASLAARVRDLEEMLAQEQQLRGLLPICSYCKKVRDDQNYWQQVDTYISIHSRVQFTPSVCPGCRDKH